MAEKNGLSDEPYALIEAQEMLCGTYEFLQPTDVGQSRFRAMPSRYLAFAYAHSRAAVSDRTYHVLHGVRYAIVLGKLTDTITLAELLDLINREVIKKIS